MVVNNIENDYRLNESGLARSREKSVVFED
jgi:hypothetical protein